MQYNLTTIEEIINIVNEKNLKNFIIDFNNFLLFHIHLKHLTTIATAKGVMIKNEPIIFKWIDDGKNEINISIKME